MALKHGLTGVDMALRERPDLIIMDINLPDISGLEATSRLKSSATMSHVPIVAFTAATSEEDRERFMNAGCDGYMTKPASAQILLDMVQQYL